MLNKAAAEVLLANGSQEQEKYVMSFPPYVVNWYDYGNLDNTIADPSHYHYHLLAEGDSWFTFGAIPSTNFLHSLRFQQSTIIASCAKPGDTIRNMSNILSASAYRNALSDKNGRKWDLILLSGGGNDFINAASRIIRPSSGSDPRNYCRGDVLQQTVQVIKDGYAEMVKIRDSGPSRNVPILTHTYDYPTPRPAPAHFFGIPTKVGPWLYPALNDARIPQALWASISDYMFEYLAESISGLQHALPNFFVVHTHGTLNRAQLGDPDESGDWRNEIHPSNNGYKKLAEKLNQRLRPLLG
jgi:lysophospholipase L1-like esterase